MLPQSVQTYYLSPYFAGIVERPNTYIAEFRNMHKPVVHHQHYLDLALLGYYCNRVEATVCETANSSHVPSSVYIERQVGRNILDLLYVSY